MPTPRHDGSTCVRGRRLPHRHEPRFLSTPRADARVATSRPTRLVITAIADGRQGLLGVPPRWRGPRSAPRHDRACRLQSAPVATAARTCADPSRPSGARAATSRPTHDVVTAIADGVKDCVGVSSGRRTTAGLHDDGFTDPACAQCHDSNISAQHDNDCAVCHDSTDGRVVAAIDERQHELQRMSSRMPGRSRGGPVELRDSGKTTGANAAPLPATPHTGYTLTSVKCNVCHSVHRSAVVGPGHPQPGRRRVP